MRVMNPSLWSCPMEAGTGTSNRHNGHGFKTFKLFNRVNGLNDLNYCHGKSLVPTTGEMVPCGTR